MTLPAPEYPPYRVGPVLVGLVTRPRYTMGWIIDTKPVRATVLLLGLALVAWALFWVAVAASTGWYRGPLELVSGILFAGPMVLAGTLLFMLLLSCLLTDYLVQLQGVSRSRRGSGASVDTPWHWPRSGASPPGVVSWLEQPSCQSRFCGLARSSWCCRCWEWVSRHSLSR